MKWQYDHWLQIACNNQGLIFMNHNHACYAEEHEQL